MKVSRIIADGEVFELLASGEWKGANESMADKLGLEVSTRFELHAWTDGLVDQQRTDAAVSYLRKKGYKDVRSKMLRTIPPLSGVPGIDYVV